MKYIFFIAVLTITFAACDKPEDEYIYLDAQYYDYMLFPEGSWWVYEEDGSGAKDTVTVIEQTSTQYDISGDCSRGRAFKEFATLKVKSSFNKDTLKYTTGWGEMSYNWGKYKVFTTHLKHAKTNISYNVRYTYYEYDSLITDNKKYYDVKVIENEDMSYSCEENFTSAKGIGIIQRTTCEGEVWNLKDYHIQKDMRDFTRRPIANSF